MGKWQIDKSIINDNKKQLAQKCKAYFLFFEAFLIGHCMLKKKFLDVFVLGNLQHASSYHSKKNLSIFRQITWTAQMLKFLLLSIKEY